MKDAIKILLCLALSIGLSELGYPFYTWQFWAFGFPLLILLAVLLEIIFYKKKQE